MLCEFQPSKRIHSGFYVVGPFAERRGNLSFNPPRGFIPVSTRAGALWAGTSARFQPSKRIHSGFYALLYTIASKLIPVSTLQEDSFRFLPRPCSKRFSFIAAFQPSKRIHSGFYGIMTYSQKVQNMFQPSKRIHSGFYAERGAASGRRRKVSTLQEDSFRFLRDYGFAESR